MVRKPHHNQNPKATIPRALSQEELQVIQDESVKQKLPDSNIRKGRIVVPWKEQSPRSQTDLVLPTTYQLGRLSDS